MSYKLKSNSVVHELVTSSDLGVTSAYISLSGIGFTFYKQGKVVICVLGGISSFNTAKYTKLTSNGIPSAYRPNAEVSGTCSVANNNTVQSSSRVYFKASGEIGIITGVTGNQEYYGCACWISAK